MPLIQTSVKESFFTCPECGIKKTFKSVRMRDAACRLHAKKFHGTSQYVVTETTVTKKKVNNRI